ncbi:hypothetical protein LZZ85_12510 [Terrimonas sp. NA20]|uniref:CBM6 domain-containing protein n=1 Tax=Terrimonas ginsenosidimutans TaxID=2908004 RepID=A0ABS9KS07_9BACT|nr:hypothetical protein [Terrimonas ginsenosidimutans]MCG2615113.1 hypothetical protein [Terrimonas ginsenosidimutans]
MYTANAQQPLWKSEAYSIYADSVVQQTFHAKAISAKEIVSDYKSPANEYKPAGISFKFSINGKDNEMVSGTDHHFTMDGDRLRSETPLIVFGKQLKPKKASKVTYLKAGSSLLVKLDMRHVFNDFNTKGFYAGGDGSKIYKEDFKAVYIAGSSAPLIWDFDNLVHHTELKMNDDDGDGIYEILLNMNVEEKEKKTLSHWKLETDLSAFPRYQSPYLLGDALYNMSLEEMNRAIEPDSTLRTGKEWAGVWTRDVSYSIILSMAHLQPRAAQYSLMRKVDKKKKIIQDTGTGGAWPVSTDRMIWAVAAWEIYKVTGNVNWLKDAYEVIRNSIYADMKTVYDEETGLVKGESSFLDWREQTYPVWMQPADIFESENLGTNAVHFQANIVAASMAAVLNDQAGADIFRQNASRIKKAINEKLWMPDAGTYAQYLYGRGHKMVSPRTEALGAALCVIFGIAGEERAKQVVSSMPISPYGITCIYPQIPGIPPYHNNGIWPFVQSYWLWAGAQTKNETSVMESIAAIYRPAALFATNKENFVATNGDYAGTQINSSNMLWSLAGNISIVHHVLFGIRFNEDRVVFQPFVPKALQGERRLDNFRYRDAILDITLQGYGDEIEAVLIDGVKASRAEFPASQQGRHSIRIVLKNTTPGAMAVNHRAVEFTPAMPILTYKDFKLHWQKIPGAVKYKVFVNGMPLTETRSTSVKIFPDTVKECQVIAIDQNGLESFASEPFEIVRASFRQLYETEEQLPAAAYPYAGYSGKGFIESGVAVNPVIRFAIEVDTPGDYRIDFRYANGNGPVNTDNKCAVRTLLVDDQPVSSLVFPQRGKDEWSDWGWSSGLTVKLGAGKHVIQLEYKGENENMSIDVNQVMLDVLRITMLGK